MMLRQWTLAAAFLATQCGVVFAGAEECGNEPIYMSLMGGCKTVESCLARLDPIIPEDDTGFMSCEEEDVAAYLRRFGKDAKLELLRRATGPHPGWRNFSGAVLGFWKDWDESDLPALVEAHRIDPGGWIARPLGDIGTPAAIEALIEGLGEKQQPQIEYALSQIGSPVLPRMIELLEESRRSKDYREPFGTPIGGSAEAVLRRIAAKRHIPEAVDWAELAADPREEKLSRLVRFRALTVVVMKRLAEAKFVPSDLSQALELVAGTQVKARTKGAALRLENTLSDGDRDIRAAAVELFVRARVGAVGAEVLAQCLTETDESLAGYCIDGKIAPLRQNGASLGSVLLDVAKRSKGELRAAAISALGQVGYKPAAGELARYLESEDWREVMAAARALGWLGATDELKALQQLADNHWLPDVQREAGLSVDALQSPPFRRPVLPVTRSRLRSAGLIGVELQSGVCPFGRWRYGGRNIERPAISKMMLSYADGTLGGTDRGEWGGELSWRSKTGSGVKLSSNNVQGMERAHDGAVVATGLAHMYFNDGAVHVARRADDRSMSLETLFVLPGAPSALATLVPDEVFVVWSMGHAFVFKLDGVIERAKCVGD